MVEEVRNGVASGGGTLGCAAKAGKFLLDFRKFLVLRGVRKADLDQLCFYKPDFLST